MTGGRGADPEPAIIELLRRLWTLLYTPPGTPGWQEMCRRQLHEVETILDVWDEREDLDELRTLLGLNSQGRGRRRKMRTAVRESRMAMMVAAGVDVDAVAEKFRVDRRTVERAVDEWGEYAERVLSRQRRRGFKLDVERLADKK